MKTILVNNVVLFENANACRVISQVIFVDVYSQELNYIMFYFSDCMDVSAFEWLSQLRFYWDRDIDDCIVRQTNTHFMYGYEYLGNSGRLVITPLTDR